MNREPRKTVLSIRREFFLVGLAVLFIISVVVTAVLSVGIYNTGMGSERERLAGSNRQISSYIQAHLEGLSSTVKILAANPDVIYGEDDGEESRTRALEYFKFIEDANPSVGYCYAGYTNGDLLINDYVAPEGFDTTVRPWYVAAVERQPQTCIGLPYRDANTDEWLIAVSQALLDKGTLRGVVSVDSTLTSMDGLLNQIRDFDTQANFVVDGKGTILVHRNPEYLGLNLEDIAPGSMAGFRDASGFNNYDVPGVGIRTSYYTRLGINDWTIVSSVDFKELIRPIRYRIVWMILLMAVLAVILEFVQIRIFETRFVQPLEALKNHITDITGGISTVVPSYTFSNSEIASIARYIESTTESSLSQKAYELNLILESTSDGMIVLSDDRRVVHYNRRFLELWQLHENRVRFTFELDTHAVMRSVAMPEYEKAIMAESPSDGVTTTGLVYMKNGVILEQYSCPIMEGERVTGRLWSFKDVTAKVLAEERLKFLAATDELTGLWNRRYFMGRAEYEITRALRDGQPLSLTFLDIDHFKSINDAYGHAAGDRALELLSSVLSNQLRSTDTIGRIGGEEFAILFPNTDMRAASSIAEKIRSSLEAASFRFDNRQLGFTVSMGIAELNGDIRGIEALLLAADITCYKAKEKGRNRVETYVPYISERGLVE